MVKDSPNLVTLHFERNGNFVVFLFKLDERHKKHYSGEDLTNQLQP
jgi:hypothetical protein